MLLEMMYAFGSDRDIDIPEMLGYLDIVKAMLIEDILHPPEMDDENPEDSAPPGT